MFTRNTFPFFPQTEMMDCGAACLQMMVHYFGVHLSLSQVRAATATGKLGTSFYNITEAAASLGINTTAVRLTADDFIKEAPLPVMVLWGSNHFVVVLKASTSTIKVADPAHGMLAYSYAEFESNFCTENKTGIAMAFEPTEAFYSKAAPFFTSLNYDPKQESTSKNMGVQILTSFYRLYRKGIFIFCLCLLAGSLLQFVFPFITQSIVDIGIGQKDLGFIGMILVIRLMLFVGQVANDIIRSFLLINISSRINISLASGFFKKLLRLPISFFDSKFLGDILQRIHDNDRIENFLTNTLLSTLFSILSFVLFSIVLFVYSSMLFVAFMIGTITYFLWIGIFMKRRETIDYKKFRQYAKNQGSLIEFLVGMQEIKLNNAESTVHAVWQKLQVELFHVNLQSIKLEQVQLNGSSLITELKNILITFLAAKMVLDNELSLGMMLSVSFILGQLNGPIYQMVGFIQHFQDARLSFKRITEIYEKEEEVISSEKLTPSYFDGKDIYLNKVTFSYEANHETKVLNNLTLHFPAGKTTAIVGASGSGKSTLLKLLIRFYQPEGGEIMVGNESLNSIAPNIWRGHCGVVMQEGHIFSDSITANIAVGVDDVDVNLLIKAAKIANVYSFIEELPLRFDTKIGMDGMGLSTGQKQRILIARAVYKNPVFLFFDEATSALDSNNENVVMDNLTQFFANKTVVIIAHRLSTVRKASKIVVMHHGVISEEGTHQELLDRRGSYYNLIQAQLSN